jgi:hypothetical protein
LNKNHLEIFFFFRLSMSGQFSLFERVILTHKDYFNLHGTIKFIGTVNKYIFFNLKHFFKKRSMRVKECGMESSWKYYFFKRI